jgi:hypothetical protein
LIICAPRCRWGICLAPFVPVYAVFFEVQGWQAFNETADTRGAQIIPCCEIPLTRADCSLPSLAH